MLRPLIAFGISLAILGPTRASDPSPLWELNCSKKDAGPGWLSYSPDGRAITAVMVQESRSGLPRFDYMLQVWGSSDRKERFKADLGFSFIHHWGDELAAFPSETTILTGGVAPAARHLEDGQVLSSPASGVVQSHTLWFVPDLQEAFYLAREPVLHQRPVGLIYQTSDLSRDQLGRPLRHSVNSALPQDPVAIRGPREGMQAGAVALNPGRTRLVASFREETPVGTIKHSIAMYRIRTVDELDLTLVADAPCPRSAEINVMAFTRNGNTLITGGAEGTIALWGMDDFETLTVPRAIITGVAENRVVSIAVSRDWRTAAAVTWDRTKPNLLLIDLDTGKLQNALKLEGELLSAAFSPDGQTLLIGSRDGKIRAWDVATLRKDQRNMQGARP